MSCIPHVLVLQVLSKLQECACSGLPFTMYLQDSLDIRVTRMQHRLGLTVTARPAAQQHAQPHPTQQSPQTLPAQTGEMQASTEPDITQEQYVVQCCAHNKLQGSCMSEHGQRTEMHFGSLQQAVMVATMLEWMVTQHSSPSCASQQEAAAVQAACAVPSVSSGHPAPAGTHSSGCRPCALLGQLPAAAQRLQQYLQQAAQLFDAVLPTWHQLGALVPAAGDT